MERLLVSGILGALVLTCGAGVAQGQAAKQPPRLDQFGDPLPEGVLTRVGTVRLRAGDRIAALGFTPDSRKVVSANRTTGIHVWDVATGKLLHTLPASPEHPWWPFSPFATIVLSPDCATVAELDNSCSCTVRDVATGKQLFKIEHTIQHNHALTDTCLMRFTPDGKTLALMNNFSRAVEFRDVATGKVLASRTFEKHPSIPFLAFSPDGKALAMAGLYSQVALFDVATGKRLRNFGSGKINDNSYGVATFSPDGKWLAALGGCLEIWEVATGKRHAAILDSVGRWPDRLTFTPDSRRIIGVTGQGTVRVFDVATGKLEQTLPDLQAHTFSLAVSPDGKYLASTIYGIVQIWDLAARKPLHDFTGPRGMHVVARFSPDGKTIASTSWGYFLPEKAETCFWDAATGKLVKRVGWQPGEWVSGAVSSNGRVLAQGALGKKITVSEVATRKVLMEVDESTFVPDLALTPDGKFLMATLIDHTAPPQRRGDRLKLWDTVTTKTLLDVRIEIHNLRPFLDESSGKLIVPQGTDENRTVTCYDVPTGRPVPGTPIRAVGEHRFALSPNGQLLAGSSWKGGPVTLRALSKGDVVDRLATRGQVVSEMRFSPNGRLLAAGTNSGPILVWDVRTGEEVAHLPGHRAAVHSVNWSADGRRLVSASADLTILVWDAEPWAGNGK